MKRIPIDECPAGPVLDAAVAEILGWQKASDGYVRVWIKLGGNRISVDDWKPSTDIATAWELAKEEKMAVIPLTNGMWSATPGAAMTEYWNDSNHEFTVRKVTMGYYERYLNNDSLSDTAPLAIARAYLNAKGVEFVEVPDDVYQT